MYCEDLCRYLGRLNKPYKEDFVAFFIQTDLWSVQMDGTWQMNSQTIHSESLHAIWMKNKCRHGWPLTDQLGSLRSVKWKFLNTVWLLVLLDMQNILFSADFLGHSKAVLGVSDLNSVYHQIIWKIWPDFFFFKWLHNYIPFHI